jgi:signal transduction histidine kinase/CheY-like chemotaxis protein
VDIRSRLRSLILLTLLPIAIFGVAGAWVLVERERATFERGARDRVRALTTAIDAELYAVITPLEVLARSSAFEANDLAAFRAEAQRALEARRGDWVNVLVSHPRTGGMLMNLLVPPGDDPGPPPDPETIIESARSGRPSVSRVAPSPAAQKLVFAVRMPVRRQGEVAYVLSALVDTAVMARLVDAQDFPSGWAIAIIDGTYRFVVRRPAAGGSEFASDSLKQALAASSEGFARGQLLDGAAIYRAHRRSTISAWSASIAVPSAVVDASLRGVWVLMFGFALAAALGLWIAWRLAARISAPIIGLAAAAPAVGRGDASSIPPPGPVEELRGLSQALGEAARAIRVRDRAKDEFLAMLGHELRNPLASVANAAQILKLGRAQPEVIDNVSQILERQVGHMKRLVDDLLEVGRVTGGKVRLEPGPLDLAQVAGDLLQTWKLAGRFLQHVLQAELSPVWISADRARIEQVISNLIDNALKYTSAGGTIRVSVRPNERLAVLEVSDTGEGMTPALIERMFDLFVQGERDLARQPGGLGIGLTMAKRLVELHDGKIGAASDGPGKGATVTVELPAIEAPVFAAVRPARVEPRARRILVVEDNADARESLVTLLRLAGQEVHEAQNGAEALRIARAVLPDVALIDIGLPDLDGYELARRLKADRATRGVRLLALTGYGGPEDRRRALAAGFDEHVAKPVEAATLERLIA